MNERSIKAERLIRETKILNIARLAKMLVDLFGLDEPYSKIGKRENQEVEMYLKELDGYITFVLTSERQNFDCFVGKANNPVSKISIKVEERDILKVLSNIIKSKANLLGLAKLLKYILPGKIKIKGSYMAAIKLVRCLMIGKHEVYKNNT
jgi:hypothetical protein